ncbi:MAG: hypothetical protein V8R62_12480 [Faecalibacillus intestinalis]
MRVRYINSQNYSVDFVDANILPTSGYLHQRKWNTTIENDSVSLSIGNYTYTITLTLRGSLKKEKKHWIKCATYLNLIVLMKHQELCTLEIIILNAILFHQILALLILIQEPM